MSLFGAFDKTKHLTELADPLPTAAGVLTAAQRRALVQAALGLGTDAVTYSAVQTFTAVPVGTITLAGTAGPYNSLTWNTSATGAAGIHAGANFITTTAVALGDWANAINGKLDFGTAGRITGLGGAVCAEIDLGAGCTEGSYAPFEAEIILPASGGLTGTRTSFLSMNVSGHATAVGRFDDFGYLFDLNGLTSGAAHLFTADNTAPATVGGSLRVQVGGTSYYLILYTGPVTHT